MDLKCHVYNCSRLAVCYCSCSSSLLPLCQIHTGHHISESNGNVAHTIRPCFYSLSDESLKCFSNTIEILKTMMIKEELIALYKHKSEINLLKSEIRRAQKEMKSDRSMRVRRKLEYIRDKTNQIDYELKSIQHKQKDLIDYLYIPLQAFILALENGIPNFDVSEKILRLLLHSTKQYTQGEGLFYFITEKEPEERIEIFNKMNRILGNIRTILESSNSISEEKLINILSNYGYFIHGKSIGEATYYYELVQDLFQILETETEELANHPYFRQSQLDKIAGAPRGFDFLSNLQREKLINLIKYPKYTSENSDNIQRSKKYFGDQTEKDDANPYENLSKNLLALSIHFRIGFKDMNFNDLSFSGVNMSGANFTGTSFENTDLAEANFSNCNLLNTNFNGACLENSEFGVEVVESHSTVKDMQFLNHLVIGDDEGVVSILHPNLELSKVYSHPSPVFKLVSASSYIACISTDSFVTVFDMHSTNIILTQKIGEEPSCISYRRNKIIIGCENGEARIINPFKSNTFDHYKLTDSKINTILWPEKKIIVTAAITGIITWRFKYKNLRVSKQIETDCSVTVLKHIEFNNTIAGGAEDSIIRLWGLESLDLLCMLKGHSLEITSLDVFGTKLVSSSEESIVVWNLENNTNEKYFTGHSKRIKSVCFVQNGSKLASCSEDNYIKIWDLESFGFFEERESSVPTCCDFSESGKYLAIGNTNRTITIWHTDRGSMIHKLTHFAGEINDLKFIKNKIVSAGESILIWNYSSGFLLKCFEVRYCISRIVVISGNEFGFSDKSGQIGIITDFKRLKMSNYANLSPIEAVCYYSSELYSENKFVVANQEQSLLIIDRSLEIEPIEIRNAHEGLIWEIKYYSENEKFYTCSVDSSIKIWNLVRGSLENIKSIRYGTALCCLDIIDSQTIVCASYNNHLILIDTLSEEVLFSWAYNSLPATSLALSENREYIAFTSFNNTTKVCKISDLRDKNNRLELAFVAGTYGVNCSFNAHGISQKTGKLLAHLSRNYY